MSSGDIVERLRARTAGSKLAIEAIEERDAEIARLTNLLRFCDTVVVDLNADIKRYRSALHSIADGKVGLTETHYEAQRRHVNTARAALSGGTHDGASPPQPLPMPPFNFQDDDHGSGSVVALGDGGE